MPSAVPERRGPATPEGHVGDIAFVLHTHMPYVEGFGTFPFGEEWLYDAVCRSYLRLLPVLEDVTVSITPVLADQLELEAVAARTADFVRRFRIATAESEAELVGPEARAACLDEADEYRRGLDHLAESGGGLLDPFRRAQAEGRIELWASAATHAVLPLVATDAGRRLQVLTGIASHRRRFGEPGGFWLPECAYDPGLERLLEDCGVGLFCVDQSRSGLSPHVPVATAAGPVALPIDWEAISWLWSLEGYPSDPEHCDFARRSFAGVRAWTIAGDAFDPERGREVARRQAAEFAEGVAARLATHRAAVGRPGLLTFAVDTELLGHWWWSGPDWIAAVLEELRRRGVRPVLASQAAEDHEAVEAPLRRSSWGEGKDLRTWDSRPVADLAWAARRLELRVIGIIAAGELPPAVARRTMRELLAVQSSDWAFLDARKQAGDYGFERATDHSLAALEAIDSRAVPPGAADGSLRNLAPFLNLAPVLEP